MSSTAINKTNASVPQQADAVRKGVLPQGASLQYFTRYLKAYGVDGSVTGFVNQLPEGQDSEPYFDAVIDAATSSRKGDPAELLTSALRATKNLSLLRYAYDRLSDQAAYRQKFQDVFGFFPISQTDHFRQAGLTDTDQNGVISRDEPGYNPGVDRNRDNVLDISELFASQGALNDPASFAAAVNPQRSAIMTGLSRSYDVAGEGVRYRNMLVLVANGNYPEPVRENAQWLIAEYDAEIAIDNGDFTGALAIYRNYAEETGQEPAGYYRALADNEQQLGFLQSYYAYAQEHGQSSWAGGEMGGVEFILGTVYNGKLFELANFNPLAKGFLDQPGTPAEYRQYFWHEGRQAHVSGLSSTDLTPSSVVQFTIDQLPSNITVNGISIYQLNGSDPNQTMSVRYNLTEQAWTVTLPAADLYARPNAGTAEVKFGWGGGQSVAVANLTLEYPDGAAPSQPGTLQNWYEDNAFPALRNGEPISWNFVVAPDGDDLTSFEALSDFRTSGVSTGLILQRFFQHPEFVIDPNSPRGRQIVSDLRAKRNDPDAVEDYVDTQLTDQERLRFLRLGDQFIGGGMSALQYLEAEGFTYDQSDIQYPSEDDPCLVRITATKYIPIGELEGPMKEFFAQNPELAEQYPDGVPVRMTVEFYSTTRDADLAVGRHLAARENTAFQTHAYKSDLNNQHDIDAGTIPNEPEQETVGFVRGGCHAGMFPISDTAQFGGGIYYAPLIDAPYTGTAHFLIPEREVLAMARGTDPYQAAAQAYETVGSTGQYGRNDPNRVYTEVTDRNGSAYQRFSADNSVIATLTAGRRTVYNQLDGNVYLVSLTDQSDRVTINPGNPFYGYFLNQLGAAGERPAAEPQTTVARDSRPQATPAVATVSTPTVNAVF
ncbi:MAG: hypothetical protein WC529_08285 [Candidatus Margulisiibacteriota bacterium]